MDKLPTLLCAVCAADAIVWDGSDGHQGLRCADHVSTPRPFEVRELTSYDRGLWDHQLHVDAETPKVFAARLAYPAGHPHAMGAADSVHVVAYRGDIVISGDWAPNDGVIGRAGAGGPVWFAKRHGPEFLAGRFLEDIPRADRLVDALLTTEAELREQLGGDALTDAEREAVEAQWATLDMLRDELGEDPHEAEIDEDLWGRILDALQVGSKDLDLYGPDPAHMAHLFAVQRRFRVLYLRHVEARGARRLAGWVEGCARLVRARLLLGGAGC